MKKDVKLAYGIAVVLLVVGILSYTAAKAPAEPLRKMFSGAAGKVLFDHKAHTTDYDLACNTCHHHPPDQAADADMLACSSCHVFPKDGKLPETCNACHGEGEVSLEGMPAKTDALHKQCIGCHKDNSAGPVECAACHVM